MSRLRIIMMLVAATTLLGQRAVAHAQTDTTFTYQGQLNLLGQPYTGTADYRFTLFDDPTGGNVVGSPLTITNIDVEEGLFNALLNFGPNAFAAQRWLAIEVRTPAWNGVGTEPIFTLLTGRQPVTRAPYSIQTRGLFVTQAGDVGIGTIAPTSKLHVIGDIRSSGTIRSEVLRVNTAFADFGTASQPTIRFGLGNEITGLSSPNPQVLALINDGEPTVWLDSENRVGIRTLIPQSTVHILHPAVGADWGIRVQSQGQGAFQTGMRVSNDGFFEITNQIGGTGFARLSSSGVWTAISDERAKENILPLTGVLDHALALDPVAFCYTGAHTQHIGFTAQNVAEHFPSLVTTGDDLMTLDYAGLSTVAIAALQELKAQKDAEIGQLRAANDELQRLVRELAAHVEQIESTNVANHAGGAQP